MASFRKHGKVWYYRFVDASGKQRERRGSTDKRVTEGMAAAAEADAANVRHGYVDPRALAYRDHEARPIAAHLEDFGAALAAKRGTGKHPRVTRNRAAKVLRLAGVDRISGLAPSRVLEGLAALRAAGLGAETINHHVRAVKAFGRWLWRDGRCRDHPLPHLATAGAEGDRRRRRRALDAGEAARLVRAAEAGPVVKGLAGPDRARCYELAMATGLRASELAALTPERLRLDADPPTATVPAGYTKNNQEAVQPIPAPLARRLAPWVAALPPGRPVFPLPARTAEMIRADLAAAGLPYETPEGYADFHSLRGVYISNLVSSGASVKVVQALARHSTPVLTIGIYARARRGDLGAAVEALPDLAPASPTREGEPASSGGGNLPLRFPYRGDAEGHPGTPSGDDAPRGEHREGPQGESPEPLAGEALDAQGRPETPQGDDYRRWGSNPHGGSPPEDFKSAGDKSQDITMQQLAA